MDPDLNALMQRLYTNRGEAEAVLVRIGYPSARRPMFETAHTFWLQVLPTLDDKVKNGTLALLKQVVADNPGCDEAADLLDGLLNATAQDALPLPPPPPLTEEGTRLRVDECPTLILEEADLPEEFLAVALELFGQDKATLLYTTPAQTAVRIPDPGDRDEAIRQQAQAAMRTYAPDCRVHYRKFPFQPYLYSRLVVFGPDTSGYELKLIPATSTPEDIAVVVVLETREAQVSSKEGTIRVVIDHESAGVTRRLDPYTTLHQCGVSDGDRLRVAPDAIAGSLAPRVRLAALVRASAQIRGFAAQHSGFTIAGYDDEEMPSRITVEIDGKGLAPPDDLPRFLAPDGPDSLDELIPRVVRPHRVALYFPTMFPLVAPLVVWETPVFHPNIRDTALDEFPAGTLQFHPLLLNYRPHVDLAYVATVITDIAMYRAYDLTDGSSSPNAPAAEWAATETGQAMIKAIGGRPLADVGQDDDRRARLTRLLWLKPLNEVPYGP